MRCKEIKCTDQGNKMTQLSVDVLGSRRNRRSLKRGPNWILGIVCIIFTIAVSVFIGNILGNHILNSGNPIQNGAASFFETFSYPQKASKNHSPISPSNNTLPYNNSITDNNTIPFPESNTISSNKHKVSFPALVLPPSLENSNNENKNENIPYNETEKGSSSLNLSLQNDQNDSNKDSLKYQEEDLKKPKNSSSYHIQAGLFLKEKNAREQLERLSKEGVKCKIVQVFKNGASFFRVQVGKFNSKATAQQEAQELAKKGYSTFVIGE